MGKRSDRTANLAQRATLDALRPDPARPSFVWDSALPGFGVLLYPTGARRWIVFYRFQGVQRRVTIGDVATLTPQQARARAMDYLAKADAAKAHPDLPVTDPAEGRRSKRAAALAARKAERERASVGMITERYLSTLALTASPGWAQEARRLVALHLPAEFLALPVAEVTTEDVRQLHERLHRTPALANNLRAVLSAIFNRASESGDLPPALRNPVAALKAYPRAARARNLGDEDPGEWARFGAAWRAMRAEAEDAPPHKTYRHQLDAIMLLLLTGGRHTAVRVRRWEDVRWDRRLLLVTPAQKGVDRIPLGAAALAHLETFRPATARGRDHLFPGRGDGPITRANSHAWDELLRRAEITGLTIHDLRRTFATVAGEVGIATVLQDGLVGHKVPGVRGIYARQNLPALLDAADTVAAAVRDRLATPLPADPTVLPLARRRRARSA